MDGAAELVAKSLVQYGNAVLLLPTPRWEKQVAAHIEAFWAEVMTPMLGVAATVETAFSMRARSHDEVSHSQDLLGRPDSNGFAARWLEAVHSGSIGESNVFLGLEAAVVRSSGLLRRALSVGYFDHLAKRLSPPAMAAVSRCLVLSELAFGIGPPPFGSAYVIARLP